jgi:murein biosynthesis integral membrane protein MurJ
MIDVKKIIQATTIVTVIGLVVKGLGFFEKLLLAYFFGTGIEVDAYLVVFTIPFSAYVVLREVIGPAFLPTFMRTQDESLQAGWRLFSVIATVLLLLLGAATIAGILAAAPLISIAAPGFDTEQQALATRLARLIMPALLFLGLSTLTTAALHAEKRFALPALGMVSFRTGPLILFLLLGGIPGLVLGVVLGAVGKLAIEALGLRKRICGVRPLLDLGLPPVRTVGRLAAPLLLALSLSLFLGPLVENAFASRVGVGGVSALAFARKIAETLTTILPYALGLVLLPFSAEMAARHDNQAQARTLLGAVRGLTFLFLPVTVGLMILREPFIQLLFERGAFTTDSTQLTAGPLFFYALALLPFALEVIVVPFFFARQDTLTPVVADIATFVLNVILIPPLMSLFGLGGIALAVALAKAGKVLALLVLYRRRVPEFRLVSLGLFAGQMMLASLAAGAVLLAYSRLSASVVSVHGFIAQVVYLGAAGLLAAIAYSVAAYLLKVDEIRLVWQHVLAWKQSLGSRA